MSNTNRDSGLERARKGSYNMLVFRIGPPDLDGWLATRPAVTCAGLPIEPEAGTKVAELELQG